MPVQKGPAGVKQEMAKFKAGALHSGGPRGPIVKDRKQAIAISLSEAGLSRKRKGGSIKAPKTKPGLVILIGFKPKRKR